MTVNSKENNCSFCKVPLEEIKVKMGSYFVIIYKKGGTKGPAEILEIKRFYGTDTLFAWMLDNREESFAIYEGKCVLDYS